MADIRDSGLGLSGLTLGRLAVPAIGAGAVLLAVVATVWTIMGFWSLGITEMPPGVAWTVAVGLLLVLCLAWALALLLWGVVEILRRQAGVQEALQRGGGMTTGSAAAAGRVVEAPGIASMHVLEQVADTLNELRDIALLNDEEKAARVMAESSAMVRQLERDVPVLLREHRWQEALGRVLRARERFPSESAWNALAEQVEQARAKFEAHDVEAATREINDLAALHAWDRAAGVVRELQRRHPDSEKVAELARRVGVQQDRLGAEERARLMSRAQEATTKRDWVEAMRWVEEVIARYPNSAEAQDLRLQLPTVRANAEIHIRQQMEAQIRDLIRDHHFPQALRMARELIARYPDSPQAGVLREQLPRLEQRAAEGG